MDWNTFIAPSLLSIIGAAIVFIVKKTTEKTIETKFKELENRQKIRLQEFMRREGKVFDDQYEALKSAVELAYMIRNCAREIIVLLTGDDAELTTAGNRIELFNTYDKSFRALMFNKRAILPEGIFNQWHDFEHDITAFASEARLINHGIKKDRSVDSMKYCYSKIETHYFSIVGITHSIIGVQNI